MEREIGASLREWARRSDRKPLLLRGARQTGKTFLVRKLGSTFERFIEINFEKEPGLNKLFEPDLSPARLTREIGAVRGVGITSGRTLLFFDEIQNSPKAITALRYFHEEMPDLHVIGAGSLLEFSLQRLSVPVGRIQFVHVRPFSFKEYLAATDRDMLARAIGEASPEQPLGHVLHEKALSALQEYLVVGGMPGVIERFRRDNSIPAAREEQLDILETYRADFAKYATRAGTEIIEKVFSGSPATVGSKTKYSEIDPDARAYQVKAAIDLLEKAQVVIRVRHTSGAGVPLAAGVSDKHFKMIFLDVGLMQRLLDGPYAPRGGHVQHLHAGVVAEQFVGQELRNLGGEYEDTRLYYWHREARGARAEVDYLTAIQSVVVPIEVKASVNGHLKSLHRFLAERPGSPIGCKISEQPMAKKDRIVSIPLYAVRELPRIAAACFG